MAEKKSSKPKSAAKPYPEAAPQPAGKVAEAVATYIARSKPKPRVAARMIAGLAADDEVWTFVKANDLLPHLETAISLAQKAFLKLKEIKLSFASDPEIPEFSSITIKIKAAGSIEELVEQNKAYVRFFIQSVPSAHHHQIDLLLVEVI
jgi:hypothetical protein